jgi:serine/threonine protein kinase
MRCAVGARLGSYEILSPLGAGGMSEVYKARDTRLDRNVAIKIPAAALALDDFKATMETNYFGALRAIRAWCRTCARGETAASST